MYCTTYCIEGLSPLWGQFHRGRRGMSLSQSVLDEAGKEMS